MGKSPGFHDEMHLWVAAKRRTFNRLRQGGLWSRYWHNHRYVVDDVCSRLWEDPRAVLPFQFTRILGLVGEVFRVEGGDDGNGKESLGHRKSLRSCLVLACFSIDAKWALGSYPPQPENQGSGRTREENDSFCGSRVDGA